MYIFLSNVYSYWVRRRWYSSFEFPILTYIFAVCKLLLTGLFTSDTFCFSFILRLSLLVFFAFNINKSETICSKIVFFQKFQCSFFRRQLTYFRTGNKSVIISVHVTRKIATLLTLCNKCFVWDNWNVVT